MSRDWRLYFKCRKKRGICSWKWYHHFQNKDRKHHHCWWCQIFQAIYTLDRCLQQGEGTALYWCNAKYTFKYNISLKHKAISMGGSLFSLWKGVLASWLGNYKPESVSTKHLLVFDGCLCTPSSWVKGCNHKLVPLSFTPQLFSFSLQGGLGKV